MIDNYEAYSSPSQRKPKLDPSIITSTVTDAELMQPLLIDLSITYKDKIHANSGESLRLNNDEGEKLQEAGGIVNKDS